MQGERSIYFLSTHNNKIIEHDLFSDIQRKIYKPKAIVEKFSNGWISISGKYKQQIRGFYISKSEIIAINTDKAWYILEINGEKFTNFELVYVIFSPVRDRDIVILAERNNRKSIYGPETRTCNLPANNKLRIKYDNIEFDIKPTFGKILKQSQILLRYVKDGILIEKDVTYGHFNHFIGDYKIKLDTMRGELEVKNSKLIANSVRIICCKIKGNECIAYNIDTCCYFESRCHNFFDEGLVVIEFDVGLTKFYEPDRMTLVGQCNIGFATYHSKLKMLVTRNFELYHLSRKYEIRRYVPRQNYFDDFVIGIVPNDIRLIMKIILGHSDNFDSPLDLLPLELKCCNLYMAIVDCYEVDDSDMCYSSHDYIKK